MRVFIAVSIDASLSCFRALGDHIVTTCISVVKRSSFVLRLIDQNKPDGGLALAATLVLLLDLQIETVATKINQYWIWLDGGPYYGVPTANFVAWWLIGLAMAGVVAMVLGRRGGGVIGRQEPEDMRPETGALISRLTSHVSDQLPACLYLLSTLMFAIINLAHGYTVAGLVGVAVLSVVAHAAWSAGARPTFFPGREAS
jgi:putative membrane protein